MTIDEALAALADAIGSDDAQVQEAARALRTKIPALGQNILNAGAALKKKELQADITRLTGELETAKTLQDETAREFDAFKAKTPDIAAVEARMTSRLQPKIDQLTSELESTRGLVVQTTRAGMVDKFVNELVERHRVHRPWAQRVVAAEYGDRFVANPDQSWKVLQPGSEHEYDAATQDEAIAKLAAKAAETVDPQYITTGVGGGGGSGGGAGGSSRAESELVAEKRGTVRRMF